MDIYIEEYMLHNIEKGERTMRKILVLTFIMVISTSVVFASPLMDYSKGKVAIDVTVRPELDMEGTLKHEYAGTIGSSTVDGKKGNFDFGLTVGLGNQFAIQYKQFNPATKNYWIAQDLFNDSSNIDATVSGKVNSDEFNLLYKLDKNFAVFTGLNRATASLKAIGLNFESKENSSWQVGLIGVTPIADKTKFFGIVSGGSDVVNWEVGLSYEFVKDAEFNVSYRRAKFKNLDLPVYVNGQPSVDVEAKGIGYGFSFKF